MIILDGISGKWEGIILGRVFEKVGGNYHKLGLAILKIFCLFCLESLDW